MLVGPDYVTPTISLPDIVHLKRESEPGPDDAFPGVYFLYDEDDLVYIGQSENVARRFVEHKKEGKKKFDRFACLPLEGVSERLRLEGILALVHLPPKNATLCLRLARGKVSQLYYQGLRRPKRK